DVITTFVATGNAMNAGNVIVTVVNVTKFTYTVGTSGNIGNTAGFWVRNGLYNVASSVTGPAVAYRIVPAEWCADANLTDCIEVVPPAAPVCTYTEEIQNYAKWFAYYRTRMQMMKTSVGISFRGFISNPTGTPPKPDSLRVGFITIHAGDTGSVDANQYLKITNFNTTQANNLYTKFYQQIPGGFTPLREALSRAGWIFAGKLNAGLTNGIPADDDPIQS